VHSVPFHGGNFIGRHCGTIARRRDIMCRWFHGRVSSTRVSAYTRGLPPTRKRSWGFSNVSSCGSISSLSCTFCSAMQASFCAGLGVLAYMVNKPWKHGMVTSTRTLPRSPLGRKCKRGCAPYAQLHLQGQRLTRCSAYGALFARGIRVAIALPGWATGGERRTRGACVTVVRRLPREKRRGGRGRRRCFLRHCIG